MAPCQAKMDSDWSEKEFRKRNEKKVELELTFFAGKFFRSDSQRNVTAHACDVFRSNFFHILLSFFSLEVYLCTLGGGSDDDVWLQTHEY